MNKWTRTLTAAIAAIATAVIGAPPGHAQPATGSGTESVQRAVIFPPRVVNLRVGEHVHFDRVVIDVRGGLPGRTIRYVHQLRYDGSGARVPLHGRRFVNVTLYPAAAHKPDGTSAYRGPQLQQYSMPVLRGVAFTGDFEGYVSFGIALRRHVDFRVSVLHSPNRIVIDFPH